MFRYLFVFAWAFALVGCGGRSGELAADAGPQRLIRVDWYGQQSFRLRSSLGITMLTNPFAPGSTSFRQPRSAEPDILLISHESPESNYVDGVDNNPRIFRGSVGVGQNSASGIRILGIPIFADEESQDVSGLNVIYRWSMDGLRFCFLGDLRRGLSASDAARIGAVDVLFMPVGGTGLNSGDRQEIIRMLRPRVIIPMGSYPAVTRFASGYSSVYRLAGSAGLLSREALPAQQTVLLFRSP